MREPSDSKPWDQYGPTTGAPQIESWSVTKDGDGETWRIKLKGCEGEIVTDDVGSINSLKRFRNLAASQLGKFYPDMRQAEWSHHLVDQQRILKRERSAASTKSVTKSASVTPTSKTTEEGESR